MTDLWIPIVLVAAALQTVRNAGTKHLGGKVSPWTAAWTRFGVGLPVAAGCLAVIIALSDEPLPTLAPGFLVSVFLVPALIGAAFQMMATVLLVQLYRMRNFAVGSTYVRTEAVLAAIVGTAFFAEPVDAIGWIAIIVSVGGVVVISLERSGIAGASLLTGLLHPSAAVGVASGLCFAMASFYFRAASLSFGHPNPALTAGLTLLVALVFQTASLGAWIAISRPAEFRILAGLWRPALLVGGTSALGSFGWLTAMTLQKVAYVKALAQIEFVFALGVSYLFFHERSSRAEFLGMGLVVAGILILVLGSG